MIPVITNVGPLFSTSRFVDTKDPCILFDGSVWHIYGSGGDVHSEKWNILHATAPSINGPWTELDAVIMHGIQGDHVAAPSVIYDESDSCFHMMVQTEFTAMGGTIEYLKSTDGGTFTRVGVALTSIENSSEAGIYDPHQAIVGNKKYIVYAGTPKIEGFKNLYIIQPDVYLVESDDSWPGPWIRLGKILDHTEIEWHHNARTHLNYEWGIEGPQLVQLPNETFLLNATCFLSVGVFGTRQRVFFAVSNSLTGPYRSLGPVLEPSRNKDDWDSGENGHATVYVEGELLHLFYQSRSLKNVPPSENPWQYGHATFKCSDLS